MVPPSRLHWHIFFVLLLAHLASKNHCRPPPLLSVVIGTEPVTDFFFLHQADCWTRGTGNNGWAFGGGKRNPSTVLALYSVLDGYSGFVFLLHFKVLPPPQKKEAGHRYVTTIYQYYRPVYRWWYVRVSSGSHVCQSPINAFC